MIYIIHLSPLKLGVDVDYGNYFISSMSNRLFRIKINEEFKGDNLFYTSLANNSFFDSKTIREIEELVNRYSIKEVYFVLSKQNKIISKVMIGQSFSQIGGLQNFNSQINKHKEHSMLFGILLIY